MKNEKKILKCDFFKLLLSSIKIDNYNPIIERYELQDKLFEFCSLDEYKILFNDLIDENSIDSNCIDLSGPFVYAYAYGLISIIHDGSKNTKYIIKIDDKQALRILEKYTDEEKDKMNELLNKLYEDKKIFQKINKKTN